MYRLFTHLHLIQDNLHVFFNTISTDFLFCGTIDETYRFLKNILKCLDKF